MTRGQKNRIGEKEKVKEEKEEMDDMRKEYEEAFRARVMNTEYGTKKKARNTKSNQHR